MYVDSYAGQHTDCCILTTSYCILISQAIILCMYLMVNVFEFMQHIVLSFDVNVHVYLVVDIMYMHAGFCI